jgi:hypothetical protein
MEIVKGSQREKLSAAGSSQIYGQQAADPAAAAGLAKNDTYKTDNWVVGSGDIKTYVVPKNTIPEPLAKAFLPS